MSEITDMQQYLSSLTEIGNQYLKLFSQSTAPTNTFTVVSNTYDILVKANITNFTANTANTSIMNVINGNVSHTNITSSIISANGNSLYIDTTQVNNNTVVYTANTELFNAGFDLQSSLLTVIKDYSGK